MHVLKHVCICMHTFIQLHPDYMEVIKTKQAICMKKNNIHTCSFTSSEGSEQVKFLNIILHNSYLNLHTFIHMQY